MNPDSVLVIFIKKMLGSPLFWVPVLGALDGLLPLIPNLNPLLWPNIRPILCGILAVAGIVVNGIRAEQDARARRHQ